MLKKKFSFLISIICINTFAQSKLPVYLDDSQPIENRVEDALSRMTPEEKVAVLHAQSKFSSAGVPRLGIPDNWMTDGPHGIRTEVLWDEWDQAGWTNDSCTAFPALTCMAASWNPEIAALYGKAIGEEARFRNKNVLLGPGVNIYRTPLNGRNFEYMGEDPYLASQMVVPYIQGVQSNGVAACVKHYALNNQEIDRDRVNVVVDDRALYEIYLPAFKAAVQQGGAWAIMGSYNRYKNEHACHNSRLLNTILKGQWNFDGVVISDWGGVHDTQQAIENGLDMEFGSWTDGMTWSKSNAYDEYYLANPYLEMLRNGRADTKTLDDKVRRVLRLSFRTTMNRKRPFGSLASPEHFAVARQIAEEGIVLLKNETGKKRALPLLPIDKNNVKKILVVGENAVKWMTVGGGSSQLKTKYEITPLEGLKNVFGADKIDYARGYAGEEMKSQDGVNVADTYDARPAGELKAEALAKAQTADIVLFIGGLNKNPHQDCEGDDRQTLELPYRQDALIADLAKVNNNLVVVILSGNAVAMPWINEVPAIVESWYCGSEAGNALARILSGDVNPSGKLPFTFAVQLNDYGSHALGDYPGDSINVSYKESIFVGYRWLEKQKIRPLFAFGHGLSYTQFTYGHSVASAKTISGNEKQTISVPVKNTGQRAGKEVVQLYIGDEKSSLPRPLKELKHFQKIDLKAGEEKTVIFTISMDDLKFFDDEKQEWKAENGKFKAYIGSSSAEIKTTVAFEWQ
jgi:beta-glucosidase